MSRSGRGGGGGGGGVCAGEGECCQMVKWWIRIRWRGDTEWDG